jgi:rhodanese-related sulfurtransferase/DNA-binding transcriptional ArsR family regulator
MARDESKAALYEQFARVGKALSNPVRLELLDLLAQGERSVEDLAEAAGMRLSNTSAQLKVLAQAGLLTTRRAGTRVFYRVADTQVDELVGQLKELARKRLADVERAAQEYLGNVDALEPVSLAELAARTDAGDLVILDVRPPEEFNSAHIPGAINIPLDQLASRLTDLPKDTHIVAYCRHRYCVLAPQAVRLLRDHQYNARPLDGGIPEWRQAGFKLSQQAH